jgi:DNA-binding transcriptional MocR family regulator
MHLVGWLPAGVSGKGISDKAAAENLKLAAISAYSAKKLPRDGFILGYTAFDRRQIREAVKKLKALLSE